MRTTAIYQYIHNQNVRFFQLSSKNETDLSCLRADQQADLMTFYNLDSPGVPINHLLHEWLISNVVKEFPLFTAREATQALPSTTS